MSEVEVSRLPRMPVHALSPLHSPHPTSPDPNQEEPSEIPRSASFTYLTSLSDDHPAPTIKRTFSENVLSLHTRKEKVSDSVQNANKELFRRASKKAKKRMSLSQAKFSLAGDDDDVKGADTNEYRLSRSMTGTIRSFARKSWISSRPSSPTDDEKQKLDRKQSWSPAKKAGRLAADRIAVPERAASRSPSADSRDGERDGRQPHQIGPEKQKNATVHRKSDISPPKRISARSSISSFRSLSSYDKRRSSTVPPVPSMSSDQLSALDKSHRRDPLWNAFRQIEGELTTFHGKTSMQRAKVLRTVLLPFLQDHQQHPSSLALRPDDLERRVTILNKWWCALLEILSGRNNQIMTGSDRPAFLEAASQIMIRPEWRIPGFPHPDTDAQVSIQQSSTSTTSTESEQLLETIYQNIRAIFVQNLLAQLGYVIDKLCLRSAPASLVNFGGKTCAYAFFFCPGIAEMLIRLWRIAPGTLQRIFSEAGVQRGERLEEKCKEMAAFLPAPMSGLIFVSQASLARMMQLRRQVPAGTEHFNWHGPWLGRWSGRDSDLFFHFAKFYHVLLSDYLPQESSAHDRVCMPGVAPVHAQILIVLEITIYRLAGQSVVDHYASGAAAGSDAADSMAPSPMTVANATRQMNENRLVMLLRDVLGDKQPGLSQFRELFASSFGSIVKAATRKVSLYNNDACFVLCDFLEEVFPIMLRHRQDSPFLDWPFWYMVCKQMMHSQNTLTQVRLIAFVYSIWNIIIVNEERKKDLILDWLLDQDVFDTHFCHWSPMVRHYYFRLLCWRVTRSGPEPSALDLQILARLSVLLNRVWSHHQYLSAEADMRDLVQPSTTPCSPAPSRSLVIIRTDNQTMNGSSFSNFDKFLSQGMNHTTPYQKSSSALNSMPGPDTPLQNGVKKRWSMFKNILPFATPGNDRPGEVTPPQTPDDRRSMHPETGLPVSRPNTPPHQAFSFKFSMEWADTRQHAAQKSRKLVAPVMPYGAKEALECLQPQQASREIKPTKPSGSATETVRYSGRALAEWAQVTTEHKNFFMRRKQEGVPRDSLVETPILEITPFRMLG